MESPRIHPIPTFAKAPACGAGVLEGETRRPRQPESCDSHSVLVVSFPMRSLPLKFGMVRIASVSGELRDIRISGLSRVRLLFLFRNFHILDFPVLSRKQQQLITRIWHSAPGAASADAPMGLIGTLKGFSPQLCEPAIPATKSGLHGIRVKLPGRLRIPALLAAIGVLLFECALWLGLKYQLLPPYRVTAVAAARPNSVRVKVASLSETSDESVPSVAASSTDNGEAPSLTALSVPDADAPMAPSPKVVSPNHRVTTKALERPEVIIRVSVDRNGRPQAIHALKGDQKMIPAARAAASRWTFQPCSRSSDCQHLLKFTDYGDASALEVID